MTTVTAIFERWSVVIVIAIMVAVVFYFYWTRRPRLDDAGPTEIPQGTGPYPVGLMPSEATSKRMIDEVLDSPDTIPVPPKGPP